MTTVFDPLRMSAVSLDVMAVNRDSAQGVARRQQAQAVPAGLEQWRPGGRLQHAAQVGQSPAQVATCRHLVATAPQQFRQCLALVVAPLPHSQIGQQCTHLVVIHARGRAAVHGAGEAA